MRKRGRNRRRPKKSKSDARRRHAASRASMRIGISLGPCRVALIATAIANRKGAKPWLPINTTKTRKKAWHKWRSKPCRRWLVDLDGDQLIVVWDHCTDEIVTVWRAPDPRDQEDRQR